MDNPAMMHSIASLLRRFLRWSLWTLAGLILVLVLGVTYVALVGVPVDASLLRAPVARIFSETLGREVRFEGPMELQLSARPRLRVGGLHISNPPGFDGDFASLGEARFSLDLWPLLDRRLVIKEIAGSDVHVRLQHRADGSNNWTFLRPQTSAPEMPGSESAAIGPQAILTALDIGQVSLDALKVEYVSAEGRSHYFDLHRLDASAPAGQPLTARLIGAVEKTFPYELEFTGGSLADLADLDQVWPVDLTLRFLSTTLTLNGHVSGARGELNFGLGTESFSELERLLQTKLPDLGPSGVAGTVMYEPGRIGVPRLSGAMGNTTLFGNLAIDTGGERPKLSGALTLPALDLRPFLTEQPAAAQAAEPPQSLAELYRELSEATFSLTELNRVDVDVMLSVDRWLSLPGDVHEASLRIKVENGRLEAPVQATVSGVALSGHAHADASVSPPRFELALSTSESELGGLAQLLTGVDGVRGWVRLFDVRLAAQGEEVRELVRTLDVKLELEGGRLSYGNVEGSRPVSFTVDKLAVALPPGQALRGDVRGSLLGRPLAAELRGGALEPMMLDLQTPIEFTARSGGLVAHISGTLQPPAGNRGTQLAFSVGAAQAGEVASWFGLAAGAKPPIVLAGKARMTGNEWRLDGVVFQLGRTTLNLDLARTGIGKQPLIQARLDVVNIDVDELESLLPEREKTAGTGGPVLDIPILPRGIDLTDSDIAVQMQRFTGTPVAIRDVRFNGRIRDGYMHPSRFSADIADIALNGAVQLDLRGDEPTAALWLYAQDVEFGRLLRKLNLARDLEATLGHFSLHLVARSGRLGDMLARSELTGEIGGGRITLRDPNTRAEALIELQNGLLRAAPGAPVGLEFKGSLDAIPVAIRIDTAAAHELANPTLRVPFTLKADAAESEVTLSGALARPIGSEIELALEAGGRRFDTLNRLVRASLPPWGPWSAAGRFRMSPRGYELSDMRLRVGESELNGTGSLRTDSARPRIDIALDSPNIQLDDFRFGDWTPVQKKPDEPVTFTPDELRRQAAQASDEAQKLLSPDVLRRQDAYIRIRVDQVVSGNDRLGGGRLDAQLENGRAVIGPVTVEIPGGSAGFSLGYEPTENAVQVDLKIDIDRFDYGILARRIQPATDLGGRFSVHMDVSSRAQYLSEILRHGSGRIEFAVWPENLRAGVFDLWAVNVLVALVPAVDQSKESKVNCAIGSFELLDGKLVDRTIILDTTRMRVTGHGTADFDQERMRLRLRPRAKTAQFLSLATPIEVAGPFDSFRIRVSPGDILETVGRIATSVIWVPLQKLFGKRIPRDGADVCASPDIS
ncbi:MAG: AsmA family protein [Burkholderiales bacterium]